MRQLHIDIETYSSIDIMSSGAYKYAESPDFEIILCAYAIDDGPEIIIDLLQGERYPAEFLNALQDPQTIKIAHNANFERQCFKAVGYDIPVEEWRCSAVKAGYCGLPLSLAKVSEALELGEKGKLSTGRALIKYFCVPCKPTKVNGGRLRNMPEHDLDKWEEFKEYCIYDVVAERAVCAALEQYAIPENEQRLYNLDQKINDRGVHVDANLVDSAIAIDVRHSGDLKKEMINLTGLENPNSTAQLGRWIGEAMKKDIKSLAKGLIPALIEEAGPGIVTDALNLRLMASKTSVKKYQAMTNCAGYDVRVRGLFQFYGTRTGRWAGRLVQLQNLPQNHLKDLDGARNVIAANDYGLARMQYENIPSTLSQLIRTALIAKPGHTLVVSDFSAIEARVLAWMAGEEWRLEVFNTHGKIYEASAAMMFDIPVEDIQRGSPERDKGKVAELALGYGGAVGALKQMGGEAMGLSVGEMKGITERWRRKNPKIVLMWKVVEAAAIRALRSRQAYTPPTLPNLTFHYDGTSLTIQLPSGRKLFYREPRMGQNKWGHPSIEYKGVEAMSKKWVYIESYGGKFVENIIQAIARDLLAEGMERLEAANFNLIMHVHDEVVAEEPTDNALERLEEMNEILGQTPDWAEGLPLGADGFVSNYYKKD